MPEDPRVDILRKQVDVLKNALKEAVADFGSIEAFTASKMPKVANFAKLAVERVIKLTDPSFELPEEKE